MRSKSAKKLTTTGILSAISVLLSFWEFPLPIFPAFLKLDVADLPSLVGTVFFGLDVGILVQLIKNIVSALITNTSAGIGEFVNFVVGVMFIIPFATVYNKKKNTQTFIASSVIAMLSMTFSASLLNYYVTIPLYSAVLGIPVEDIVSMGTVINSNIDSLQDLILLSIVPFNLIKGALVSFLGYLIVMRLTKTHAIDRNQ